MILRARFFAVLNDRGAFGMPSAVVNLPVQLNALGRGAGAVRRGRGSSVGRVALGCGVVDGPGCACELVQAANSSAAVAMA